MYYTIYIYKIYSVILSLEDQSIYIFTRKSCLLQIEHPKQQVVKTLTLGSCPLNSVGSHKQVSIKGGYHSQVSFTAYPC